jgi:hypothetical protein
LNSGHSRATAFVIRCQGEDNLPRCFSTWAAIALAGIGELPATLADRSIEIQRKRKTTSEPAARLDRHARGALGEVARRIAPLGARQQGLGTERRAGATRRG